MTYEAKLNEFMPGSGRLAICQYERRRFDAELLLRHAMSHFAVPPFDTVLRDASGHTVEVNFGTSFLRDGDGRVIGILGIARDIRERRRLEEQLRRKNEILEEEVRARTERIRASEARYRSLIEQIPIAVVCTDAEGRVTSFNRAAKRLFGWDDTSIGALAHDAWGCRGCRGCEAPQACREAAESEAVWVGECVMACRSGGSTVMFHTLSWLRDDDGRPVGVVHVVSDLSDPSAAQRDLVRDAHDLFYRLNVLRISLPPLRERHDDIPFLVEHFLQQTTPPRLRDGDRQGTPLDTAKPRGGRGRGAKAAAGTPASAEGLTEGAGRLRPRISAHAMKILTAYSWPGNVRELKNVVEQASVLTNGSAYITARHLPRQVVKGAKTVRRRQEPFRSLTAVERDHTRVVLDGTAGNRTRAAKILGICRATLVSKIRKYGL